ncbi:MAG: 30S ribosomal protein S19e [Candidatus Marsarchaeota archaeon]|jgi:small subunit ribosomal protein S19e|nr:30S ribosomal protein S19e [Candidatus Marsarchaeota archaeon]
MANINEVDTSELVNKLADKLKETGIQKPAYVGLVKTGAGKDRVPTSPDFWYTRCASILRQVYFNGPIGISRLRTRYGNRKRHVVHRHHHVRSGGSIIKDAFDTLEKSGYIKKTKSGRVITPSGRSLMDKTAESIKKSA